MVKEAFLAVEDSDGGEPEDDGSGRKPDAKKGTPTEKSAPHRNSPAFYVLLSPPYPAIALACFWGLKNLTSWPEYERSIPAKSFKCV